MTATTSYCTFRIGGDLFGVEVENVREILSYQELTPIPLAPPAVRGLLNLRGQIISAIDPRSRLGLEARAADARPTNLLLDLASGPVSLLVDEIGDVVAVATASRKRPPETLARPLRELVRGVHELAGDLLLVLDAEAAVTISARAAGDEEGRGAAPRNRNTRSEVEA